MSFEQKISALRPRYLARSEKRVEDLLPMIRDLEGGERSDRVAALRLVFHDIAGTAGTLGFGEIGTLAREADDLLTERIRQGGEIAPGDATVLGRIADGILERLVQAQVD